MTSYKTLQDRLEEAINEVSEGGRFLHETYFSLLGRGPKYLAELTPDEARTLLQSYRKSGAMEALLRLDEFRHKPEKEFEEAVRIYEDKVLKIIMMGVDCHKILIETENNFNELIKINEILTEHNAKLKGLIDNFTDVTSKETKKPNFLKRAWNYLFS